MTAERNSVTLPLLVVLLSLGAPVILEAQHVTCAAITFEAGFLSSGRLNQALKRLNPDSRSMGFLITGISASYRSASSIFELSCYRGTYVEGNAALSLVEPSTWRVTSGFGSIIWQRGRLGLYPSVGLGASGLKVRQYEYPTYRTTKVSTMVGASVDLSLRLYYFVSDGDRDGSAGGMLLGLKAGYFTTLARSSWSVSLADGDARISPFDLQGWYVTASFGGLGFMKQAKPVAY